MITQQLNNSKMVYLYPAFSQAKAGDSTFEKNIDRYHKLVKKIDEYEQEKDKCIKDIKEALGDIEEYKGLGYSLTYRWQKGRTLIDTKLLKEKYEKAYNMCCKKGEALRVLRINFK